MNEFNITNPEVRSMAYMLWVLDSALANETLSARDRAQFTAAKLIMRLFVGGPTADYHEALNNIADYLSANPEKKTLSDYAFRVVPAFNRDDSLSIIPMLAGK